VQVRTELKRKDILDSAALLFSEHGYQGTSMKQLALEANASTSTIYSYFSDKTDLLSQSIERRVEVLEEVFLARMAGIDDPIEALLRGLTTLNETVAQDPLLSRLIVYESRVSDAGVSIYTKRVLKRIDGHGIKLVENANTRGTMECDDPEALIIAIRMAFQGWLLGEARGEKQISEARLTRTVKHIILGFVNDD